METLLEDRDLPALRLSLRDLTMLLRVCGEGNPMPPGQAIFSVRFIGPLRPGGTTCLLQYDCRPGNRHAARRATCVERILLAAEAIDAAARAIGRSANELWNRMFSDFLTRTLLERCEAQAGNGSDGV